MSLRRLSNCWLVAMSLWLASRGREYSIVRRSRHFSGLLPHFLYGSRAGWRYIKVIEYIPPKNQRWRHDFVLCFPGSYRVWHFRVESVRRWATKEQARADFYFKPPSLPPASLFRQESPGP